MLIMLCGCRDLWRVNSLVLRRMLGMLSSEQADELAGAHPRDLRVARWFRWLSLAGFAAAAGYIAESLSGSAPTSARFWQSIVFAALALLPLALHVAVTIRDHRRRGPQTLPARHSGASTDHTSTS